MTASESRNELFAALSKAQASLKAAAKDTDNAFFKSRYADLASVWDACREALTANGLSVLQLASADANKVTVETVLGHASGQYVGSSLTVVAKDASPQAVGSAITYARRYGLSAIVGVAPDDDDGEAAQGRSAPFARRNGSGPLPQPQPSPPAQANGKPQAQPAAGLPVKPASVAERVKGYAAKLAGSGLCVESDVTEWVTLKLGPLEQIPDAKADEAAELCKVYRSWAQSGFPGYAPDDQGSDEGDGA